MSEKERLGHLKEGQEPPTWSHGKNLNSEKIIDALENLKLLIEQQLKVQNQELERYRNVLNRNTK